MKFSPAELSGIEYDLEHIEQPLSVGTRRLLAFIKAELSDVAESVPDTIGLYFANSSKLPGRPRPNPFERPIELKGTIL